MLGIREWGQLMRHWQQVGSQKIEERKDEVTGEEKDMKDVMRWKNYRKASELHRRKIQKCGVGNGVIRMMESRDTEKKVIFVIIGFHHNQIYCVNSSPEFDT